MNLIEDYQLVRRIDWIVGDCQKNKQELTWYVVEVIVRVRVWVLFSQDVIFGIGGELLYERYFLFFFDGCVFCFLQE